MATKSQTSPEGRIDRRITPRSASKPLDPTAPIVFKNAWGDVDQVFHSTSLGMPCELAAALSAAFHERDAGGSPQTRRHKWRALRLFGSFLESEGILSAREINAGTIQRYLASMDVPTVGKRISIATMGLRLALIRPLLEQVEQANPDLFGSPLNIPWSPFSGLLHEPKVKDRLNERELKAVLAVPLILSALLMIEESADRIIAMRDHAQHIADAGIGTGVQRSRINRYLRSHGARRWRETATAMFLISPPLKRMRLSTTTRIVWTRLHSAVRSLFRGTAGTVTFIASMGPHH